MRLVDDVEDIVGERCVIRGGQRMHRKKAELRGGEDGQGAGARRRSGAE